MFFIIHLNPLQRLTSVSPVQVRVCFEKASVCQECQSVDFDTGIVGHTQSHSTLRATMVFGRRPQIGHIVVIEDVAHTWRHSTHCHLNTASLAASVANGSRKRVLLSIYVLLGKHPSVTAYICESVRMGRASKLAGKLKM